MKAIFLIKNGSAASAFEFREIPVPIPQPEQVLIKVESFGLNFADVMARNGMYKEAPPMPCVLGYDVAGTVASVGVSVTNVKKGDRVTAMTRLEAMQNMPSRTQEPRPLYPTTWSQLPQLL